MMKRRGVMMIRGKGSVRAEDDESHRVTAVDNIEYLRICAVLEGDLTVSSDLR